MLHFPNQQFTHAQNFSIQYLQIILYDRITIFKQPISSIKWNNLSINQTTHPRNLITLYHKSLVPNTFYLYKIVPSVLNGNDEAENNSTQMAFGWSYILPTPDLTPPITYHGGTFSPLLPQRQNALLYSPLLSHALSIVLFGFTLIHKTPFLHSSFLTSDRQLLKVNNHLIWRAIKRVISTNNLSISFHKIKAYSNDVYNDLADTEAKKSLKIPAIFVYSGCIDGTTAMRYWFTELFCCYYSVMRLAWTY